MDAVGGEVGHLADEHHVFDDEVYSVGSALTKPASGVRLRVSMPMSKKPSSARDAVTDSLGRGVILSMTVMGKATRVGSVTYATASLRSCPHHPAAQDGQDGVAELVSVVGEVVEGDEVDGRGVCFEAAHEQPGEVRHGVGVEGMGAGRDGCAGLLERLPAESWIP